MQYTLINFYNPKNSIIFAFSDTQNLLRYRRPLSQNLFDDRLSKNYDIVHNETTIRQGTKYKKVESRVLVADGYGFFRG